MRKHDKRSLLKDVQVNGFHDITAEVVKVWYKDAPSNGSVEIYISDYTSNPLFFPYKDPSLDSPLHDEATTWQGPYGQVTMQVRLYQPHADYARNCVDEGDVVCLRNVRVKLSPKGHLEGVLHTDQRYPEKIQICKLDYENDYSELKARKKAYLEKTRVEQERMARGRRSSSDSKRPRSEDEADGSRTDRRKSPRLEEEANQGRTDRYNINPKSTSLSIAQRTRIDQCCRAIVRAGDPDDRLSTVNEPPPQHDMTTNSHHHHTSRDHTSKTSTSRRDASKPTAPAKHDSQQSTSSKPSTTAAPKKPPDSKPTALVKHDSQQSTTSETPTAAAPKKPPRLYPAYCYRASPTYNVWVKMFGSDIQRLRSEPEFRSQGTFFYLNHPIRWVRLVGVVVAIEDINAKYTVLTIDDSSGACVEVKIVRTTADGWNPWNPMVPRLWTNETQVENVRVTSELGVFDVTVDGVSVDIGTVLKVKGTISEFRGQKQLEMLRVRNVTTTNEEAQCWGDTAQFKDEVLSVPWRIGEKEHKRIKKEIKREQKEDLEYERKKAEHEAKKAEHKRKYAEYIQQREARLEMRRRKEEIMMNQGALI